MEQPTIETFRRRPGHRSRSSPVTRFKGTTGVDWTSGQEGRDTKDESPPLREHQWDPRSSSSGSKALLGQIETSLQGQQQESLGKYKQFEYHPAVLHLADTKVAELAVDMT